MTLPRFVLSPRALVCAALLFAGAASSAHAHVHGVAALAVAIDGTTLTLQLDAPAESLLGFEHAPRTVRERAAVAETRRTLENAAALFFPPAAAGCSAVRARVESPLFAATAPAAPAAQVAQASSPHADIEAEYVFRCTRPARLAELRVELFAAFPRLARLHVAIAAPGKQTAVTLSPRQRVARW